MNVGLNLTEKFSAVTSNIVVSNFRTNQDAYRVDDEGATHGSAVVTVINAEEARQNSARISRHLILNVG